MDQEQQKQAAAAAALDYIEDDMILGVGTGSTVNYFIDELVKVKAKIDATVASSEATAERLRTRGFRVIDLNVASSLELYVDGADACTKQLYLTKGGGGALTREKILAAATEKFICILDSTKLVPLLGEFPIPVEVIPMARSYVARQIVILGGDPVYREGYVTDNGNFILDIYNLKLTDPQAVEAKLNNITGVVCNGIFAKRGADKALVAGTKGVQVMQ